MGGRRREMVVPPFRFGLVESNVFRCAQPTLKNYRFISRLKLRTVVAIAPEAPVEDEAMFCREQGAQLVPIRAELYREEAVTINFQQVAQVLNLLVDPDRLPALVHCPDGRVLTGIMLWCLRKLQCWDKNAAIAEYMRYCGGVPPTREVEKFADGFADEVGIPATVPRWLWGGDRARWHPGIRLRHHPPLEVAETESITSEKTRREEMLKTLAHTRADYLRIRSAHMHAHNKGCAGGSIATGSNALSGSASRRSSPSNARGLSHQDEFSLGIEEWPGGDAVASPIVIMSNLATLADVPLERGSMDINSMMDDEGPKLSKAVQALSLEGLDVSDSHQSIG